MPEPPAAFTTDLPTRRRLRAFAFDPSLSRSIHTYDINRVTINLPWDKELKMGPVDDYLEVVDHDPASGRFYPPVDLNDPYLLAQDGLPPSEGDPRFHQQMVYAVARTTIRHFERALGRKALWSSRSYIDDDGQYHEDFVPRLRIYPHALRKENAYYNSKKKALLFGYFPARPSSSGGTLPGETVFTCLSHDIVAHETTHALLDGLHKRYIEPCNMDAYALHEAFADIVALFQHFTYPEVLRHQIARTRGDLESQNLLGELAFQFGQAAGHYGALRSAIGHIDKETGAWVPSVADPDAIRNTLEPHARGAILVAAVFDAFLTIYKRRIADLVRIATGGSGILPQGELHPDLVERMAQEAAKTAEHILRICIRAVDYCPPVDVDFGDYLRALITADADMVRYDPYHYRLAIIEAFRSRGIYPRDVGNLTEENLLWDRPDEAAQRAFSDLFGNPSGSRKYPAVRSIVLDWRMNKSRKRMFQASLQSGKKLHGMLMDNPDAAGAAYLVLDPKRLESLYRGKDRRSPSIEVHSVRPSQCIGPEGNTISKLVIEITQRRMGFRDPERQRRVDTGEEPAPKYGDFIFRGGVMLLVDSDTCEVSYCVSKRIESENRINRMRDYLYDFSGTSMFATYFDDPHMGIYQKHGMGLRGPGGTPAMHAQLHEAMDTEVV